MPNVDHGADVPSYRPAVSPGPSRCAVPTTCCSTRIHPPSCAPHRSTCPSSVSPFLPRPTYYPLLKVSREPAPSRLHHQRRPHHGPQQSSLRRLTKFRRTAALAAERPALRELLPLPGQRCVLHHVRKSCLLGLHLVRQLFFRRRWPNGSARS